MLPADWEEFLARQEKSLTRAPGPVKRHQPKVTRHQSRRQRIAESQTINPVAAAYKPESKYNQTPIQKDNFVGTREVGPGDVNNSNTNWRTGNRTVEGKIIGAKSEKPRRVVGSKTSSVPAKKPMKPIAPKYKDLAAEFMKDL